MHGGHLVCSAPRRQPSVLIMSALTCFSVRPYLRPHVSITSARVNYIRNRSRRSAEYESMEQVTVLSYLRRRSASRHGAPQVQGRRLREDEELRELHYVWQEGQAAQPQLRPLRQGQRLHGIRATPSARQTALLLYYIHQHHRRGQRKRGEHAEHVSRHAVAAAAAAAAAAPRSPLQTPRSAAPWPASPPRRRRAPGRWWRPRPCGPAAQEAVHVSAWTRENREGAPQHEAWR